MAKTYRNVDGYRLEVPSWWDTLAVTDLERICNGVGPDAWPARRRAAIGRIVPWMVPGSRPHDVRYDALAHNIANHQDRGAQHRQRLYADRELLRNWIATIAIDLKWTWFDWLKPYPSPRRAEYVAACALARFAYELVRAAGGQYADAKRADASANA